MEREKNKNKQKDGNEKIKLKTDAHIGTVCFIWCCCGHYTNIPYRRNNHIFPCI